MNRKLEGRESLEDENYINNHDNTRIRLIPSRVYVNKLRVVVDYVAGEEESIDPINLKALILSFLFILLFIYFFFLSFSSVEEKGVDISKLDQVRLSNRNFAGLFLQLHLLQSPLAATSLFPSNEKRNLIRIQFDGERKIFKLDYIELAVPGIRRQSSI